MTTYIRQNIIGSALEISISGAQFEAIIAAKSVLSAALALEESYVLLIGNYVEVEQELLAAGVTCRLWVARSG